ncbi:MAG: AarF/ABC1/UbiB kinase family protein [Clostridiales bacterium]|nr:AarF/ABC1/UbiB kinase family protein [Clostridiales bacterium]
MNPTNSRTAPDGGTPGSREAGTSSLSRLREIAGVLRRRGLLTHPSPEKLRLAMEELGPTFVKLGQLLSMRADILPQSYCEELSRLRTEAAPLPFEQVRQVMSEEYGAPPERVFSRIDQEPIGSASIAQVHRAALPDGAPVVVKVQRPGIRETMAQDIALLKRALRLLSHTKRLGAAMDFSQILDEMWAAALQEMDFLQEAENMETFAALNAGIPYVACPRVEHALTTSRLLVMEAVDGIRIDRLGELRKEGYDPAKIGERLAENYVHQVLDDAFFHADPHPGNLRVREGKIVWLDFGMMGRLTPRDQALLRRAIRAMAMEDIDELKTVVLTLGVVRGRVNHHRLYTDLDDFVSRYGSMELGSLDLGQLVQELLEIAQCNSISLPPGISMLARGMLTIEGVLTACCPEVSLMQIISRHILAERPDIDALGQELRRTAKNLYALFHQGTELPVRLHDLMKMTAKGHTKLNIELTGSEEPLDRLDRMTSRLTLGVVTAALLLGSCLLAAFPSGPRLWNLPVTALAGFLFSLLAGAALWHSARRRRK